MVDGCGPRSAAAAGLSHVVYDAAALLAGCSVVSLGENESHQAGLLLGSTGTADVVDAVVVSLAGLQNAVILTGDLRDIERLASACARKVHVVAI